MARGHYLSYLLNEEGQPIPDAQINVYLAGSNVAAYVYTQESGGVATNTLPQATTNDEGYFECWVGNPSELNGYESTQKFAVAWSKAGTINSGRIENIECYAPPRETYEVDETSTDLMKNRTVSDNQARLWQLSLVRTISYTVPSASFSLDVSGAHASEALVYYHVQSGASAGWTVAHNINARIVSVTCADASNAPLVPTGITYTDNNNLGLTFGSPESGTAVVIGNQNFRYFYDLTHNRNSRTLLIQVWNTDTNKIVPFSVLSTSVNDIRVWVTNQMNAKIIVYV